MLRAKLFIRVCFLILAATALSACSSIPKHRYTVDTGTFATTSEQVITQRLLQQYRDWQHTPYAWGGMSKQGVDCSGLVYLTFQQQFGTLLPRTTEQQAQSGDYIDLQQLAPGDLVFFKTASKVRHVGIYVEQGKFLHASTSKGVILSRLDNVYWKKHFWHARRIR
ncbi:NlpC/P60 family protein [Marinomonas ostreistagni]|uniref:NlpC/P60 family protein n=1 Tax=Marinomonas ostreistagni TaxID=359209 RepID=UPI001F281C05|nr:NlpC/P60 family protein [Marinomonas ostreistagni]